MALLTLEQVSVRFASSSRREQVVLRDVSLEIEAGELVAVSGSPRSGQTTLMRIAAGVMPPTEGAVHFAGVDLARRSMLGVPGGIAYALPYFEPIAGRSALDHVAVPLLRRGFTRTRAQTVACRLLSRVHGIACAQRPATELDGADLMRVAVARALVTAPALLLVDEPALGPAPIWTFVELLGLLRSISRRDAIAVVLMTHDGPCPADADRALTLRRGTLVSARQG